MMSFPPPRPVVNTREARERLQALEDGLIEVVGHAETARVRPEGNRPLLGRITALQNPTYRQACYAWEYAVAEDTAYRRDEAGMHGEASNTPATDLPAWESTGNCRVPLDGAAVVELRPSAGGLYYSFFWPEGPVTAKLTDGGIGPRPAYAWLEQLAEPGGGYVDHPAGRSGTVNVNPAYELNGRRVALGSIVFLERGYSSPPDVITRVLVHGDGGATAQVQTVVITSATGGTFALTLFDATGNAYRIGPFPYATDAAAIQEALAALPPFATATVTGLGTPAHPFVISMGTAADVARIVGDPFSLEGRQEWHFQGQAPPDECTDVNIRTFQFDRCDYPTLNRYQLTEVYKCGALQFPIADPVFLYAVGCCDCSGSGPPDSGSSGSEASGSGPCPCPAPPLEVTLYAPDIANGDCSECAALAAGLVLTETAPCVWSGSDGGIVCATGVLTFEFFYADNTWQLFIWYTDAAGVLHLAAVYSAPAWDCTAQLELTLTYDGNGPCIWPPRIILIPGPPGAGPYWCVQVLPDSGPSGDSGASGTPCCPCWAAWVSTAAGGDGNTIQTGCCPQALPSIIPLHFSGALAGLGDLYAEHAGDDGLGATWVVAASGCAANGRGGDLIISLSCVEGNGYFFLQGSDAAGTLFEAEWGTGVGLAPVCGNGSPATFTAWIGPNDDNPCNGPFGITADFGGGDAPPCGKTFTGWGAVQYCDAAGDLINRPYFDGSIPCLTLIGYYPSEAEAQQAAATYAGTGVVNVPSAPCGPDCEGSASGSIPRVITAGNYCVHCTAGPLIGQVVCVAGAGRWAPGDGITWDCGYGPQSPCTGVVVSGPYADDCGGGCAQNQPPDSGLGSTSGGLPLMIGHGPAAAAAGVAHGLAGVIVGGSGQPIFPTTPAGGLLCLPQSLLSGVIAIGGLVWGPWGIGTIVNGPWPGPDCGGACAAAPPPPPPPCCFPLPDRLWLTYGGMLAPFGSVPVDSVTPGSGSGPWVCRWWPRVAPTACGWITAKVACNKATGKFEVSGVLYAPGQLENVPPVQYAAYSAEAVPIECKPAFLVPFAGGPNLPKIITAIVVPGNGVDVNQLQRVIIEHAAGGNFTLRMIGPDAVLRVITAPYAIPAESLQRVINAAPGFANTQVTGDGTAARPYLLRMLDTFANLPQIVGDAADLTPGPAGPNLVQPIDGPGPCPLDDFKITLTD